jgi:hypothetical protein
MLATLDIPEKGNIPLTEGYLTGSCSLPASSPHSTENLPSHHKHARWLTSKNTYPCNNDKRNAHPKMINDGETGNRTQNLLHLTRAAKLDAKKMSYH